jgi:hypothetical protein
MQEISQIATRSGLAGLIVIAWVLGGCSPVQGTSNAPTSPAAAGAPAGAITVAGSPAASVVAGTGTAALAWAAPTHNTDGSPITDLAGYHIYYGADQSAPSQTVDIPGATATSYVVQGLAPGTYYFTVVAYNSLGVDSTESNVAVKTI